MATAKAVYSVKRSITAGRSLQIAASINLELRYLQLGGYPFSRYADQVPKKGLTNPLNQSLLVVAGDTDDDEQVGQLAALDNAIQAVDKTEIGRILNSFKLPWFELYSRRFHYAEDTIRQSLTASTIARLTDDDRAVLENSRTRYVFYNQSGSSVCNRAMLKLLKVFAAAVSGIVLPHRPRN